MELRHLRYFIAVAEEGSLSNAAERRLHTAQPSLSRQIRDLEIEIGVKLLERKARGIALTAAGKVFLDHARLALMQIEAAAEAARQAEQPSDRARSYMAASCATHPARGSARRRYYDLQPNLTEACACAYARHGRRGISSK
jgi:DNA-binding transcriptional LysR family regulator